MLVDVIFIGTLIVAIGSLVYIDVKAKREFDTNESRLLKLEERLSNPIYKHLESLSDEAIKDIIDHALIETYEGK